MSTIQKSVGWFGQSASEATKRAVFADELDKEKLTKSTRNNANFFICRHKNLWFYLLLNFRCNNGIEFWKLSCRVGKTQLELVQLYFKKYFRKFRKFHTECHTHNSKKNLDAVLSWVASYLALRYWKCQFCLKNNLLKCIPFSHQAVAQGSSVTRGTIGT